MRNWEVPALLATVALGGLSSLFAQGPAAPPSLEPTPVADVSPLPAAPSPAPVVIHTPMASEPAPTVQPEPVHTSVTAPVEYAPAAEQTVVNSTSSCAGCATAAPVDAAAPAPEAGCNNCGVQASAPVVHTVAQPVGSSCGCQLGQAGSGYLNYGGYGTHSGVSGVFGVYGSGSGVGSGLLSPVANSGGLHARYPYYNYRHSWYYQGPASQNVTIVW